MVQRQDSLKPPLPDSKAQEEKDNEEVALIKALNPETLGQAQGIYPPLPPILIT